MWKFFIFLFNLVVKCSREQILERAASLTLRVLLAFFPFIVFLMSLMGFLELDSDAILEGLYQALPTDISELVAGFVVELAETRSAGVLSAALFFSVYNTTNGFRAIIRATNAAYGVKERRGIVMQVWLSFALMMLFSAALIVMLGVLVFGRQVLALVIPQGSELMYAVISGLTALLALFAFTAYIYKLACAKPLPLKHILPGAAVTVLAWAVTSGLFGFITQNFMQLPAIYGSIAGVFLLILWLNAVSTILLAGNEINAMLSEF
ncbi:MAG: YihY/virulence factor BrkB family protein [Defluviitaleaceae bacterium]|nr:YihY/virulence factor BrkB family protein [Defluviitaleaceae bacterium]MCL2263758.1 YihY/virulence factor BrkB family protein [Defluviitaleaceae bacterium]